TCPGHRFLVQVDFIGHGFCLPAGDGIRDRNVTGVQTCPLPISGLSFIGIKPVIDPDRPLVGLGLVTEAAQGTPLASYGAITGAQIGRASCRESAWVRVGGGGTLLRRASRIGLRYAVTGADSTGS